MKNLLALFQSIKQLLSPQAAAFIVGNIMAQECNQWFYRTKQWQRTAAAYKKSRQGLCERCLARGELVPGEIVHHKIHLSKDNINNPSITLDWNNLELLCRQCHGLEHSNKRFKFDENGNLIF